MEGWNPVPCVGDGGGLDRGGALERARQGRSPGTRLGPAARDRGRPRQKLSTILIAYSRAGRVGLSRSARSGVGLAGAKEREAGDVTRTTRFSPAHATLLRAAHSVWPEVDRAQLGCPHLPRAHNYALGPTTTVWDTPFAMLSASHFWSTTSHSYAYNARVHLSGFNLSNRVALAVPTGFLPRYTPSLAVPSPLLPT